MCAGMYTRLYTRVLNRYHWMYSATAYNHAYNDSGIFCIHASSHPQSLVELTQVGCITTGKPNMLEQLDHSRKENDTCRYWCES